jgi:hypothetical protein
MPTKTPAETAIEGLKESASFCAITPTETVTRSDLGRAGFDEIREDAIAFQRFAKRVVNCSWEGVPVSVLQTCSNNFNQLRASVARIVALDLLQSQNLPFERQTLIGNVKSAWSQTYTYVAPHLCFAESADSGAAKYKDELTAALKEADAAKDKFKEDANTAKETFKNEIASLEKSFKANQERMQTLVVNVEQMAQRSGVSSQARHFKELADQYQTMAIVWIAGAIVTGVCLYLYVHFLHFQDATGTTTALLEAMAPRLITVTLLSTALIFCLRNFAAMMHNMIVNRHRQTALTTFQIFVASTDDKGTRNAVLVQSTQAIFSPQPSGYLKAETDMPQVSQVTEIARGIAGKD